MNPSVWVQWFHKPLSQSQSTPKRNNQPPPQQQQQQQHWPVFTHSLKAHKRISMYKTNGNLNASNSKRPFNKYKTMCHQTLPNHSSCHHIAVKTIKPVEHFCILWMAIKRIEFSFAMQKREWKKHTQMQNSIMDAIKHLKWIKCIPKIEIQRRDQRSF